MGSIMRLTTAQDQGNWTATRRVDASTIGAVRTGLRPRVTVLAGIAVAATVLASSTGARPTSAVTSAGTDEAITTIRSGSEPAVFLARLQSGVRLSGKHRDGPHRDQLALAALATVVTLVLGQVVMVGALWRVPTPRARRAWVQRAPPEHQHI